MGKKIIGICEGSKYSYYEEWLRDPQIEIIKLGYKYHNLSLAEKCDGIMLTGGDDVSQELYTNSAFVKNENAEGGNKQRDYFEWKIMEHVEEKQKSLLAICRGLQFVNVFFGGTLLPDMLASRKLIHSKLKNGKDRLHTVTLDTNSAIYGMVREKKGIISSGHHQCVSTIGAGLKVTAMSPDGIIEAMEKNDPKSKSFFLLIQWHPERMEDKFSPFSRNIKRQFLDSVRVDKTL
jgi:putative glutamine amidotransferase